MHRQRPHPAGQPRQLRRLALPLRLQLRPLALHPRQVLAAAVLAPVVRRLPPGGLVVEAAAQRVVAAPLSYRFWRQRWQGPVAVALRLSPDRTSQHWMHDSRPGSTRVTRGQFFWGW